MIAHSSRVPLRAFLVVATIVAPVLILPPDGAGATDAVVLTALFAAAFTVAEYAARSPGLVDFRDAPPYNRIRFAVLAAALLAGSAATGAATPLGDLVAALGLLVAQAADGSVSPMRVLLAVLPDDAPPELVRAVRASAGLALGAVALGVASFALVLRLTGWPGEQAGCNLCVNLPTFDMGAEGDLAARLRRDGTANLALGIATPYLTPPLGAAIGAAHGLSISGNAFVLLWVTVLWAFIPASLLLRGIALRRLAAVVAARRDAANPTAGSLEPA